jgi:hypothetical protein
MLTPNVDNYLLILGSKLIDQDRKDSAREAKRGSPNIYRMGLLLEAAGRVKDDLAGLGEETSADAMAKLKQSLTRRFESNFPPVKALIKLIDSRPSGLKYGPSTRPAARSTTKKTNAEIEREILDSLETDG